MSSQVFTLEYQVKLTGGSQAASQMNGVNNAVKMNSAVTTQATKAQQQYGQAQGKAAGSTNKAAQATVGATRNLRGLTFGLTGLTSSLVEALGMWGIYSDSATRVEEATKRVEEATKRYGESSKEARDATQELSNAERAMNMVRRNTILSFFDMVTWVTLTANSLQKMRAQGVSLSGVFSGLSGIFNRFRTASLAPTVTDISQLGTTFTSFGTNAITPLATRFNSLGTTFSTFRGTAIATGATMTGLSTSFKATAGSAIPLAGTIGGIGVASGGAAVGVGILSKALIFLRTNIKLLSISTGIGIALVAIGLLAEHFINTAEATTKASSGIGSSAKEIKDHMSLVMEAAEAGAKGVTDASGKMAKDFSADALEMAGDIDRLAKKFETLPTKATVAFLKARKGELMFADGMQDLLKKEADILAGKGSKHIGRATQAPLILTPEEKQRLEAYRKAIADIDIQIGELIVTENEATTTGENLFKSGTLLAGQFGLSINAMVEATKAIQPIMTETMNIMKNMLTKGVDPELVKQNAEEALTKMIPDPEQLKMALFFLDLYFQSFGDYISEADKAADKAEKFTNNTSAAAQAILDADKTVTDLTSRLGELMNVQDLNARQLEAMDELYKNNIQNHIDQMLAIKDEATFWTVLSEEQFQAAVSAQEFTFAQIDVLGILEKSRKNTLLYNDAMIKGKQAAADFITELALGSVEAEVFHEELLGVVEGFIDLPPGIKLTTEELQTLIEAQLTTGQGAEALSNIINDRLAPAFEVFNSAIQAESLEDFRKAFKEIDFGDLNKKAAEDIKDMAESMKKVAEQGREVNNIMGALTLGLTTGSLSSKTFRRGIDEIAESLQRVINLDPDAEPLQGFVDWLDDLDKEGRKDVVRLLGDDIGYLATAISDGDLTPWEVIAFTDRLGISVGATNDEIEDAIGFYKTFGASVKTLSNMKAPEIFQNTSFEVEGLEPPKIEAANQPLVTATESLTTSTDNLKTSVDTLNTTISSRNSGVTPINDIEGGGGGLGGGVGPQGGKFFEKLLISENGENPEDGETELTAYDFMIMAAQKVANQINQIFLNLSGQLSNIWLGMATNFSFFMNSLAINATSARTQILTQFLALSGELTNIWLGMVTNFSAMMNSMGTNANSARTQIISAFLAMSGEASNIFLGLATNWSSMMNSMGANAQSGASQVIKAFKQMQSALTAAFKAIASAATSAFSKVKSSADSATSALKRQEQQAKRTAAAIRAIPSGGSRATGGLESAASGKFFTANGERTIIIGDNPGGRESVAFIPHNDPGPTLEKIRQMFGNFDMSARRGNASVSIGGRGGDGCIVQVIIDGEQIRNPVVRMLSRNSGGFK